MTDRLSGATVAVLGYGNQGEAHALNLRDSGVRVIVGARAGRAGETRARGAGFPTRELGAAAAGAEICAVMLADEALPRAWPEIARALRPDAALVFAHGYNLLYFDLEFPPAADVVLVSPTGPGAILRSLYAAGGGLPAYLAVHADRSGAAWDLAEAYARALGCGRARLWRTTVRHETEVDLFGEQAVLCGGMNALVTAAFETLAGRGYPEEMAFLECVHQVKYLADLLHERGVSGLREAISGTARYGDVTRGPRVIGDAARAEMAAILDEIASGAFAREWAAEIAAGRPRLAAALERARRHPLEAARRRALGPEAPGPEP